MKNTKRFLSVLACVALLVICVFAMSACGDDHKHTYTDTVTEPTCAEKGYTTHTCECGHSYVDSYVDKLPHDYASVVTKPTCTTAGYTTYTCKACGDSYTGDETPAAHDYASATVPPTCTTTGYTTYTCKACGDSYKADEVPAQHNYKKTVTEPTCTEAGYTTYTCKVCGDSYKGDEVPAQHNYKDVVTPPTCTENGYTLQVCKACGAEGEKFDEVPAAHDYDVTVEDDGNCATEGKKTYVCKVCGHSYEEKIPVGHDLVSHEAKAPTCVPGWEAYETCTRCDYTTYKEIAANGEHEYETKVIRFPTTLIEGIEKTYCVVCGKYDTSKIAVVTLNLPSVTDAIVELLGDCHYELEIGKDTSFVYLKEFEYSNGLAEGTKVSVAIKVAKAVIDISDSHLTGTLALDFGISYASIDAEGETPTFTNLFTITATLDGDKVSIAVTQNDMLNEMELDISREFYKYVASMFGLSYEQLVEVVYVGGELIDYAPILESIAAMLSDIEITLPNIDLSLIADSIKDKMLVTKVEGDKFRVEVDIESLSEFIYDLKGKTGAELIDALYGEGTMEAVSIYVKALPDMTVMQIADAAIAIAENYGINVDEVYSLVNYVVYMAFGMDFDVEEQIASRYEMTLAELVCEALAMTGNPVDAEVVIEQINTTIEYFVSTISDSTIDELYNIFVLGDPESDATVISDYLGMMIAMLDQMIEVDMLLDADGNIVEFNAKYNAMAQDPDASDSAALAELKYVATEDGYEITVNAQGYVAKITNKANETNFTLSYAEKTVVNGAIELVDGGFAFSGSVDVQGQNHKVYVAYDKDSFDYVLSVGDTVIEEVHVTKAADGKVESVHVESYIVQVTDYGDKVDFQRDLVLLVDYVNNAEKFGIKVDYPSMMLNFELGKVGDKIDSSLTLGAIDIGCEATVTDTKIDAKITATTPEVTMDATVTVDATGMKLVFNATQPERFDVDGEISVSATEIKADFKAYNWDYENSKFVLATHASALINAQGITVSVIEDGTEYFSIDADFTETGITGTAKFIERSMVDYATYVDQIYTVTLSIADGKLSLVVKEDDTVLANLGGTFIVDENGLAIELEGQIALEEYDYENDKYVLNLVPAEYVYVVRNDRLAIKTMVDGEGYEYELLLTETGFDFYYATKMSSYDDEKAEIVINTSEIVASLENGVLDCVLKFNGEVIGEINGNFNDGVSIDALIKESITKEIVVDCNVAITEEVTDNGIKTTITFDTGKLLLETSNELVSVIESSGNYGDVYVYEMLSTYIIAVGSISIICS